MGLSNYRYGIGHTASAVLTLILNHKPLWPDAVGVMPFRISTWLEMQCWSGGRAILAELSLCYSIVHHYNDAHRFEQFYRSVDWIRL